MNRNGTSLIAIAGLLAAVITLSSGAVAADSACKDQTPTTVLLVRHAEKAKQPAGDPQLSPQGERRAAELARVAAVAGIDAIYVTATTRTRRTAEDLAAQLGLEVIELDPRDTQGLADRIRTEHAGQTVLAVGHSNTVPDIIEALGGPAMADLDESDYEDLFVVTVPCAGEVALLHLRYGVDPAP